MFVIIAEPNDVHAKVVARRLEMRGESCTILNAADFPQRCEITTEYDGQFCEDVIIGASLRIRWSDVKGLWVRRVSAHDLAPNISDPSVAKFTYSQCRDHFMSLAGSVTNVINPRLAEMNAEYKPLQLRAAQSVGLRIPKTMISNRVDDIRRFVNAAQGEVIFKTLSPTSFQFTGTTIVGKDTLDHLDAAKLAPTIFQEKVEASFHIRSTIVDDVVLSAAIRSDKDHAALDWRLDRDPEITPYRLPTEMDEKIRMLRRQLGLRYGAIDIICSRDGEYFFLEVNPGGQFLFVEIHGGVAVSEAIADALIRHQSKQPHLTQTADCLGRAPQTDARPTKPVASGRNRVYRRRRVATLSPSPTSS